MSRPPSCHCHCKENRIDGWVMKLDGTSGATIWLTRWFSPASPVWLPGTSLVALQHHHYHGDTIVMTAASLHTASGSQAWPHAIEPDIYTYVVSDDEGRMIIGSYRENRLLTNSTNALYQCYDAKLNLIWSIVDTWRGTSTPYIGFNRATMSYILYNNWTPYRIGDANTGVIGDHQGRLIVKLFDCLKSKAIVSAYTDDVMDPFPRPGVLDIQDDTLLWIDPNQQLGNTFFDAKWKDETTFFYISILNTANLHGFGISRCTNFEPAIVAQTNKALQFLCVLSDGVVVLGSQVEFLDSNGESDGQPFDVAKLTFDLDVIWRRTIYNQDEQEPIVTEVTKGSPSVNEVQQLTFRRPLLSGRVGFSFRGEEIYGGFPVGRSAKYIQGYLEYLPTIGVGNIRVTGGPLGEYPLLFEFRGELGLIDVEFLEVDASHATGSRESTFRVLQGMCSDGDDNIYITARDDYLIYS